MISRSNLKNQDTLEFLQMTSVLVKKFISPLPYASFEDERFIESRRVLNWIEDWDVEVSGRVDQNASDGNKLIFLTSCYLI